jgi:UMF1 family MFS transporter
VKAAPFAALAGWVLYDWAAQPFYTLIQTFLFAPYFASAVVGDATKGQEYWGYAAAVAGVLIAIGSPLLGALADGRGRRKPWVLMFALILATSMSALWWAMPGSGAGTIVLVLALFVISATAAEYAVVFTNAIMPTLVPREQLGRLSGIGWAIGYTGGLVSLAVVAGLLVPIPSTGKTLLGLEPLLRLDLVSREGDRLVGPFSAAWLLLFMLPFFLFVPDARAAATAERRGSPLAELWATLKMLPRDRDMLYFLLGRALYTDGLSAIFVFGGIYGTAVFGWQVVERGIFGIVLTVIGIIGALAGGFLDDRVGSKRVIIGSLLLLMLGCLGILSISKDQVLYVIPVAEKVAGGQPFSSTGELFFLGFAMVVAAVAAPNQASSRALLARLAPPERMTQYFGLFAFSGKVTAFLAPFLVAMATRATGDQRLGMAAILLFLVAGLVLMLPVRERRSG